MKDSGSAVRDSEKSVGWTDVGGGESEGSPQAATLREHEQGWLAAVNC